MAGTIDELKRALFSRVRGLAELDIEPRSKCSVAIYVRPEPNKDPDELTRAVHAALGCVGMAGIHYSVSITPRSPGCIAKPVPSGRFRLAAFGADPTRSGVSESISKLVPTIGRLALEEGFGEVRVLVAAANGPASPQLLEQTRSALDAVGTAGINYHVEELPPDHPQAVVVRARSGTSGRLQQALEEDEEEFSRRVQGLVSGRVERIPVVDDFAGTKVISTGGLRNATPISCFLPIYDRAFLLMPPDCRPTMAVAARRILSGR